MSPSVRYPRRAAITRFFFFNDTATTEIYTLSLHDALPIYTAEIPEPGRRVAGNQGQFPGLRAVAAGLDRKSTRLNSSHLVISYAVFCLKKKTRELAHNATVISRSIALRRTTNQTSIELFAI